jgi:hypothetical protein
VQYAEVAMLAGWEDVAKPKVEAAMKVGVKEEVGVEVKVIVVEAEAGKEAEARGTATEEEVMAFEAVEVAEGEAIEEAEETIEGEGVEAGIKSQFASFTALMLYFSLKRNEAITLLLHLLPSCQQQRSFYCSIIFIIVCLHMKCKTCTMEFGSRSGKGTIVATIRHETCTKDVMTCGGYMILQAAARACTWYIAYFSRVWRNRWNNSTLLELCIESR